MCGLALPGFVTTEFRSNFPGRTFPPSPCRGNEPGKDRFWPRAHLQHLVSTTGPQTVWSNIFGKIMYVSGMRRMMKSPHSMTATLLLPLLLCLALGVEAQVGVALQRSSFSLLPLPGLQPILYESCISTIAGLWVYLFFPADGQVRCQRGGTYCGMGARAGSDTGNGFGPPRPRQHNGSRTCDRQARVS